MLDRREIRPLAVAALMLLAVVLADRLSGDDTVFVSLLVTAPLLTAAFTRWQVTAAVGLAGIGTAIGLAPSALHGAPNALIRLTSVAVGSSLGVLVAWRREQRERALVEMTVVADAAQNAVLWPTPPRLDSLALASRYVSASNAARVGGDLFEAQRTGHGVRLVIGDVRGKGLPALRLASAVLGCFREVVHTRADLPGVHQALEATVRRVAGPEDFVTAALVELDENGCGRLLCCGHPPPLLLRAAEVVPLPVPAGALPLGLGTDERPDVGSFPFRPGDRLLLHTDGLLEARDRLGRFFPVARVLDELAALPTEQLLDALLARLRVHVGGHIDDDVALLLVERLAQPG